MKFKLPDDLKVLDQEAIDALLADALAEYAALPGPDAELTDEQLADLTALGSAVQSIRSEQGTRAQAAEARAAEVATARASIDEAVAASEKPAEGEKTKEGDEPTKEEPVKDEPKTDPIPEEDATADTAATLEKETVTASAGKQPATRVSSVVAAGGKTDAPAAAKARKPLSIRAAADTGYEAGAELPRVHDMAIAFENRARSFGAGANHGARLGVASIKKMEDDYRFRDTNKEFADAQELVAAATNPANLPGGSLVAAGGWCAPSVTDYEFGEKLESVDGILSIPEVGVTRGGINITKGPDFSAFYADSDSWFKQTEAQAEAKTVKPFFEVDCPPFQETRLGVIGWAAKADILTSVGYPELIERYLEMALTAHAHRLNADTIGRILALLPATITSTGVGSATVDSFNILEFQATKLRNKYRMAHDSLIEGFAPMQLLSIFRSDLAYREDKDLLSVSDEEIKAFLVKRHISLQFVYDWQDLAADATDWPATLDVVLYPVGTFFRGTSDVIKLDAIYDTTGLSTNSYTAAFFEEATLVASKSGSGVRVTLPLAAINRRGRTGADNIGLVALPTT